MLIEKIGRPFPHHKYVSNILNKNIAKGKNSKPYRLVMNMKPVTTLFDPKKVINKNSDINNIISRICIPCRRPSKRLYQEDQYESFISKNSEKWKIDAIKYVQALKNGGKISADMSLIWWNVFTKMRGVFWRWTDWFRR